MSTELLEAPPALTVPFSDIPAIPTEWMWQDFLPYGTPVLFVAPGGTGKGLAIAAMAAIVTMGHRWPGEPEGTEHEPGSVVLVAPEDNANETLRFRLDAAGADVRFVHDLSVLPDDQPFMWPACKHKLRTAIREINEQAERARELGLPEDHPDYMVPVRFVAIDPLMRVLEKDPSTRAAALRVVVPLEAVCREFSVAMVVSTHTNKDGKTVAGAKALTDAFRLVFMIHRDPDERLSGRRIIDVFKANASSDATNAVYEIRGTRLDAHAVLLDPERAESPEAATARLRLTTADLRARNASRQAQGARVTTPGLAATQDASSWRVMARVAMPGQDPRREVLGPFASQDQARGAAQSDRSAAGHVLVWNHAEGKPPGWELAQFPAHGGTTGYLVYPSSDPLEP